MNMYCAIDFTESNKIFTDPESLHFLSDQPNDYEQALTSVGRILENFSKTYKCVGFGAKIENKISHSFYLNENGTHDDIKDILL